MKKISRNKKIWIAVIIILIVIVFFLVKPIFSGKSAEELKLDKFAQYLTSQNVTMYGTSWCSHCKNQKKLFEESFQYINFVDCDKESQVCALKGITGYPTWNINGTNYPGEQSLAGLAQLTNYTLGQIITFFKNYKYTHSLAYLCR